MREEGQLGMRQGGEIIAKFWPTLHIGYYTES